ncbi:hypothetical protein ACVDG5_010675 [Mesorhizobium sp. ORM6]
MYMFAKRIFDKMRGGIGMPKTGLRSLGAPENGEMTAEKAQKQPVLRGCGPIVTLWQQWG